MKRRALLALLIIILMVLMGCTGCDPNPTSIDLTQEREILTNPFGWIAQETYTCEGGVYCKIEVRAINTNNYSASVHGSDDKSVDSGFIEYTPEEVTFSSGMGVFSLRITSEAEASNPVLTLTSTTDGEKMYFSMGGTE